MPIYEYVCTKCGEESEAIQKFSDAPLVVCEICNKRGLERKLSISAFHLQGGGWFSEGYGKKAGENKEKSKEAGSSSDNGGASGSANGSDGAGDKKSKDTKSTAAKSGESGKPSASASV